AFQAIRCQDAPARRLPRMGRMRAGGLHFPCQANCGDDPEGALADESRFVGAGLVPLMRQLACLPGASPAVETGRPARDTDADQNVASCAKCVQELVPSAGYLSPQRFQSDSSGSGGNGFSLSRFRARSLARRVVREMPNISLAFTWLPLT